VFCQKRNQLENKSEQKVGNEIKKILNSYQMDQKRHYIIEQLIKLQLPIFNTGIKDKKLKIKKENKGKIYSIKLFPHLTLLGCNPATSRR
jgi:hypothetical protein